jgi:hypothetical protein
MCSETYNYLVAYKILNMEKNENTQKILLWGEEWQLNMILCIYIMINNLNVSSTRWFKYDWDYLCVNKSQFVPVIFEPPCNCEIAQCFGLIMLVIS